MHAKRCRTPDSTPGGAVTTTSERLRSASGHLRLRSPPPVSVRSYRAAASSKRNGWQSCNPRWMAQNAWPRHHVRAWLVREDPSENFPAGTRSAGMARLRKRMQSRVNLRQTDASDGARATLKKSPAAPTILHRPAYRICLNLSTKKRAMKPRLCTAARFNMGNPGLQVGCPAGESRNLRFVRMPPVNPGT